MDESERPVPEPQGRPDDKVPAPAAARSDVLAVLPLRMIGADTADRYLAADGKLSNLRERICWPVIASVAPTGEPFVLLGEITVAVTVNVEHVAVQHEPDADLSFRAKYEKAVLGFRLIRRFLGNRPVDPREIGTRQGSCQEKERGQTRMETFHDARLSIQFPPAGVIRSKTVSRGRS